MIERLFVCWLARGHCLLEGAPGLAKTLAAETVATHPRRHLRPPPVHPRPRARRPRRHPHLPSVAGGVRRRARPGLRQRRARRRDQPRPAKVQSALLEVMAERHVSIGGVTHPVPDPFLVLATQNPIESEGVYPLPEAQRDRFLMKVLVDYPTPREEGEIVRRMSVDPPAAARVLDAEQLHRAASAPPTTSSSTTRSLDYAVRLVLATREPERARPRRPRGRSSPTAPAPAPPSAWSPPAAALALMRGRDLRPARRTSTTSPATCCATACCCRYEAMADGVDAEQVVERIVATVAAPARRPEPGRWHAGRGRGRSASADASRARPAAGLAPAASNAPPPRADRHRKLDGLLHGDHLGSCPAPAARPATGGAYQPGDDVRRIDWNLTARSNATHVRDTIAERELETWFVVDGSASLDFGTARCEKRDLALAAARRVRVPHRRSGNRVGARRVRRRRRERAPAAGRAATRCSALLHRLDSAARASAGAGVAGRRAAPRAAHRATGAAWSSSSPTCSTPSDWAARAARARGPPRVVVVPDHRPPRGRAAAGRRAHAGRPRDRRRHEVQTANRRPASVRRRRRRATAGSPRPRPRCGAGHLVLSPTATGCSTSSGSPSLAEAPPMTFLAPSRLWLLLGRRARRRLRRPPAPPAALRRPLHQRRPARLGAPPSARLAPPRRRRRGRPRPGRAGRRPRPPGPPSRSPRSRRRDARRRRLGSMEATDVSPTRVAGGRRRRREVRRRGAGGFDVGLVAFDRRPRCWPPRGPTAPRCSPRSKRSARGRARPPADALHHCGRRHHRQPQRRRQRGHGGGRLGRLGVRHGLGAEPARLDRAAVGWRGHRRHTGAGGRPKQLGRSRGRASR